MILEINDFYFSIITGIISGVLTSVFIYFFYRFYLAIIKPWFVELVYKGVDITGTWRGGIETPNGAHIKAVFNIEQHAFKLKGVFYAETVYKNKEHNDYSNQYKFWGQIKNNIVIINYEAMSKKRIGTGTFMFKPLHGGNLLSGNFIHSEDGNTLWTENRFELKRD